MFLKKCLLASVLACLTLPVWANATPDTRSRSVAGMTTADRQAQTQLQTFMDRIWAESPAVRGAQATVDAAQARGESARRPIYNPSLELDTENADSNITSIGLSQTIDWGDKRGSRQEIASSKIQTAEAELTATRQRIAVETLDALARFLKASDMSELALRRSDLMKRFSDTVQQRYRAGDMRALDASLAQVVYSEALIQQAASESELAETEAALRAVSGLDLTAWPPLPQKLMPAIEKSNQAALIEALPELIVLRTRMETAKARIQLAERERRPDPTIGIRGGREDSENLLGLSLEIPLYVRNKFTAEVQAASHEAVKEEQAYRDAYRRARARLEGALGRFQNTTRAWRAWVDTGEQAHIEQVELLEQLWQAGELTATDYLIQAKQNIDTQAAAMALAGELWLAAIAWLDASGQVEHWLGTASATSAISRNSGESK